MPEKYLYFRFDHETEIKDTDYATEHFNALRGSSMEVAAADLILYVDGKNRPTIVKSRYTATHETDVIKAVATNEVVSKGPRGGMLRAQALEMAIEFSNQGGIEPATRAVLRCAEQFLDYLMGQSSD